MPVCLSWKISLPKNQSSKSVKSHALVITCVHIIFKKSIKSIPWFIRIDFISDLIDDLINLIKSLPTLVCKRFSLYLISFLVFNFCYRFKTCGFKIGIAHSIPIPLLMNPNPTQIYTIPTPNPIPLHMIPNPESNPDSDSDSSFDSDSGFGIAPGLHVD